MSYIKVCGKQIYYEEYGKSNSPTVVYMHGGPGESCMTYSYAAQKLGEKLHVISFDQYGVFRSDALDENSNADVKYHVELIEQMRNALGIKSWIPLGHSFGGMLACLYASMFPESTDAVIYDCPMWSALYTARAMANATLPYFEKNQIADKIKKCREILNDSISPKEAFFTALEILNMDEGLSKFCHVISKEQYEGYLDEHIPEPHVPNDCWTKYQTFQKKLFDSVDFYEDYLPCIQKIHQPQFLIVGEYDMTCGKDEIEWFKNHAKTGQVRIVTNSAHLTGFEHPDEYTKMIFDFIKKYGRENGIQKNF